MKPEITKAESDALRWVALQMLRETMLKEVKQNGINKKANRG